MPERSAEVRRTTAETDVRVRLCLDGTGSCRASTGIGFFDHMLAQLAHHALLDLEVEARGDLHVDAHHTVEDVGLALGEALRRALGEGRGIRRFGWSAVPMDEALARCALDVSGRPYLVLRASWPREQVGTFATELVEVFFQALATRAGLTLHLEAAYGTNAHHMIEATFKAFARALRQAVERDPRCPQVPSTKGVLLEGGPAQESP